jgi:hypothetical protein
VFFACLQKQAFLFTYHYLNVLGGLQRMKWTPQDIDVFLESRDFVDTVVIPLLPVTLNQEMRQATVMAEFINVLTMQLERQFRGRLLLIPAYTYLPSTNERVTNLIKWGNEIKSAGFTHIFYVTSDSEWKSHEEQLDGSLIWLPTLPVESMKESDEMPIIKDHVKQLQNVFIQKWREKE